MSQASNANTNKKQFVCGQCGADFVYQSGLQRHMAQKHNTKPQTTAGGAAVPAASPYALNPNSLRAQHMQRMQNMQQQNSGNSNQARPPMGSNNMNASTNSNTNSRPMSGAPPSSPNNSTSNNPNMGGMGGGFASSFHQQPGRPVPPPPGTDPNVKHFVDNREVNIFTIPREAARPAPPPPSRQDSESECDCPAHAHARAQQQHQQGGPPRPRTASSTQPGQQDDGSDDEYEPMSDIEALKRIVMKMAYEINHLRNKCSLHDKILLHMYPVFAEKMGKSAPPPPHMRTPGQQEASAEPNNARD